MTKKTPPIEPNASVRLPTEYGEFTLKLYKDLDGKEHLAIVRGEPTTHASAPLVRIHSECFTGDVLGSTRCDCGAQLRHALEEIGKAPCGVLIYLRQEGRGIGLLDKLKSYALQDQGYDTYEANVMLGHSPDQRDYAFAGRILRGLGVKTLRLITNNPEKVSGLEDCGLKVAERLPSPLAIHTENQKYLATKATKFRHILDMAKINSYQ